MEFKQMPFLITLNQPWQKQVYHRESVTFKTALQNFSKMSVLINSVKFAIGSANIRLIRARREQYRYKVQIL